jgi:hypothetical protein
MSLEEEPPETVSSSFDPNPLCGWLGIDQLQQRFARQFVRLSVMAPHLMGAASAASEHDSILLYKSWQDVLGDFPDYGRQEIGDCVGQGHGHANDLLQCVEICLGSEKEYQRTITEYIYATSREVAGILGNQDGSYGSAAVKAMKSYGCLSYAMKEGTTYSGSRAKEWGKAGAPKIAKDKAKDYLLGNAAQVKTWEELVSSIENGYPVTICTAQGFTMQRDKQGFCTPKGKWGHCMFIAGMRFDRPGACVMQSWGPGVPSGPCDLGQPDYSFWVDRKAVEPILKEGDSWALSESPTFATRELPPSWRWSGAA